MTSSSLIKISAIRVLPAALAAIGLLFGSACSKPAPSATNTASPNAGEPTIVASTRPFEPSQPAPPSAPASQPSTASPSLPADDSPYRPSAKPYNGPQVTGMPLYINRQTDPQTHVMEISIEVPSTGWTLALDHTEIVDGVARIFLTLEKPAANEQVEMALEKVKQAIASTEPFYEGQAYIHQAQRGVQTLTSEYSLAGVAKLVK